MTHQLRWPPTKEDLERLYLEQGLSAARIAKVYGLSYASQKTAESTILHHLKKNGITRRDRAEHVRKITEEMVDNWVRRYQSGESLKQIAGEYVNPVSVWNHLHARGLTLRDKVEAQIIAVTKYQRTPFAGDLKEKAYLLGLGWGDLHVPRHGRGIRIKTATTHPAMAELVRESFEDYGNVLIRPTESSLAGFEWAVQADLDGTFDFLLEKYGQLPNWVLETKEVFYAFLAGFFDAEGSIWLHQTTSFDFEISITNSGFDLLQMLTKGLTNYGFDARVGRNRDGSLWRIRMWNPHDVRVFLGVVPFRHGDKKAKAELALMIQDSRGESYVKLSERWAALLRSIRIERNQFVEKARLVLSTN